MMRLVCLATHWTPGEAHTVLEFLDALREVICEQYGKDIAESFRQMLAEQKQMQEDEVNDTGWIDDDIPF